MRATRAIIHLDHLKHNLNLIKQKIHSSCQICLAVKANAYGHGLIEITQAAIQAGVQWFGVAIIEEGIQLREKGILAPILLLGQPQLNEIQELIEYNITPVVASLNLIEALKKEASSQNKICACHLKIDTGMGRIGCKPEESINLALKIHQSPELSLQGLCTHFPGSDLADPELARQQISNLENIIKQLENNNLRPPLIHSANSGAIIGLKKSYFNMVRPGIMAYGYYPSKEQTRELPLKPVMELQTHISFIKKVPAGTTISYGMTYKTQQDTIIATLPVGYGDGYSRLLSNRGQVLIAGENYPIAGRVCMDQCMVDLGPSTKVKLNDEVILFGPDSKGPSAEDIADLMHSIPYETTCLITDRVPRIYVDG